ncbi:MAG: helix-turn-helix transcriptional regulator [Firmicutes bacterium]|nr:helix-turn-helix transcriptional regulator [Bacillota bacterium]
MHKKSKISYEPLWQTMRDRGISTYELTEKRGFNRGTLHRMRKGEYVHLTTLEELCEILDCRVEEVVRIELDKEE